jgi:FkbM family methyltransferase
MILDPLIALCPPKFDIVLADVGSAGGLKDRWRPARPIVSALLFEPRDGGEVTQRGRDTLFPIALGPEAGRATLNVTALPNMSSTLEPNRPLLETFRKKGEHTRILSTLEMPVDTLDAVAARTGRRIDAIKVDTQGSEIGILEGARTCLAQDILIAEVEVSFFHRYVGQAVVTDIVTFMADHGFELLDLYRLKRYRRRNAEKVGNISLGGGQRAGRLAYGDAMFFIEESRLLERVRALPQPEAMAVMLRAIASLIIYGKPDMAAYLFDLTADLFDAQRRERLRQYLGSLGKRRLRSGWAHHMLDYLSRHV